MSLMFQQIFFHFLHLILKIHLDHLNQNNEDDSFPMKPQRVLADVRKVMNDDDIVLSDVGAHKMWVAREYNCTSPNTCLISNGFCTMGFALPGSMGAKMVFPDKKVLSINGDAGFLMLSLIHISEPTRH